MLDKIKNIIFSPIGSIVKIFYKIQLFFLSKTYDEESFKKEQDNFFSELGLDRESGLKIFVNQNKVKGIFNSSMSSEHQVLFTSMSISGKEYKDILEIGTHDGKNALYLSKIFPNSKIVTIDLDDEDELFIKSYNRDDKKKRDEFCKERDKTLSNSKNIEFKKMNSLELTNSKNSYDMIWIDGAHGYPYVTIDIINSLRLLNKEGILICDDIWKSKPLDQDDTYHSIASHETLLALQKVKILNFKTIYKRLDKINNASEKFRKYIAIVKKFSDV